MVFKSAKTIFFLFLAGCCLATLSSCASTGGAPVLRPPEPVYLTDQAAFVLLPPGAMRGTIDALQRVEGRFGPSSYFMQVFVHAEPGIITMLGLSDMGTTIFDLAYTVEGIRFESPYSASIKPEYILADFQLAFYPVAALAEALHPIGLTINESGLPGNTERVVRSGGEVILRIARIGNTLSVENLLREYAYTIEVEV